jgi:CoA-substrate-specific enzyme activase, putative
MVEIDKIITERYVGTLNNARVAGLDLGSRATKGVLLYQGKLYSKVVTSGVSSLETAKEVYAALLKAAGITADRIDYIVGTGYGRIAIDFGNTPLKIVTEISCHAMGGHYLNEDTRTILDIGGQDSKAIKVNPINGKVVEFVMNDKCAAGTGRFLEKVAQLLELELHELGECAIKSTAPVDISSQCVVFAESEVITLIARGSSKGDIAAGIHIATVRKIKSLLKRVGLEPTIIFTGGVTNNPGMKKAIEEVLGLKLGETGYDATFAGALGAAVFAYGYFVEMNESYAGGL